MKKNAVEKFAIEAAKEIDANPTLSDTEKKAANDALGAVINNYSMPDTVVYRMAVWLVGAIGLSIVLGAILITMFEKSTGVPEFFGVALGATIGALAGMLVASSKG